MLWAWWLRLFQKISALSDLLENEVFIEEGFPHELKFPEAHTKNVGPVINILHRQMIRLSA